MTISDVISNFTRVAEMGKIGGRYLLGTELVPQSCQVLSLYFPLTNLDNHWSKHWSARFTSDIPIFKIFFTLFFSHRLLYFCICIFVLRLPSCAGLRMCCITPAVTCAVLAEHVWHDMEDSACLSEAKLIWNGGCILNTNESTGVLEPKSF